MTAHLLADAGKAARFIGKLSVRLAQNFKTDEPKSVAAARVVSIPASTSNLACWHPCGQWSAY